MSASRFSSMRCPSAIVAALMVILSSFLVSCSILPAQAATSTPIAVLTTNAPSLVTTDPPSSVNGNSAQLNGTLTGMGGYTSITVWFLYGSTSSLGNSTPWQPYTAATSFSASLTGLQPNTTYYFKAFADPDPIEPGPSFQGNTVSFTTPPTPPSLTTGLAARVTATGATLVGDLSSVGGSSAVDVGFDWGPSSGYGNSVKVASLGSANSFSTSLTGLQPGTTYAFRAWAVYPASGSNVVYGGATRFTTTFDPPTVVTVRSVSGTDRATLEGSLDFLGSSVAVDVGFDWGVGTSYNNHVTVDTLTSAGGFKTDLTGLQPGTTYAYRAWAIFPPAGKNVVYGGSGQFDTTVDSPRVSTVRATQGTDRATLEGSLDSLGSTKTTDVGFDWGESQTYANSVSAGGMSSAGAFRSSVSGLRPGTTYYFRAWAKFVVAGTPKTVYGKAIAFAAGFETPIVGTSGASPRFNSAVLQGTLDSLGSSKSVDVYFEYGADEHYGSATPPQTMTTSGPFSADASDLKAGTTYHYRPRAEYVVAGVPGTVVGSDVTFKTTSSRTPVLPFALALAAAAAGVVTWLTVRSRRTSRSKKFPQSRRLPHRTRAKPPEEVHQQMEATPAPRPLDRYVNMWFTRGRSDTLQIPKTSCLPLGQPVYLRLQIAPHDARTLLAQAIAFPDQDGIEHAHPELAGQPVPLEVAVFSPDFKINERERVQRLSLVRGQPTEILFFEMIPIHVGRSTARVCVYYRNHMLQSLTLSAPVAEKETEAADPAVAEVEMTYSADFSNADQLPERTVWLGINETSPGTHNLMIKGEGMADEVSLDRTLTGNIATAVGTARSVLTDVAFFRGVDGKPDFKAYRFDSTNRPVGADNRLLSDSAARTRFVKDMARLAGAGSALYGAVFGQTPAAEDRERVVKRVEALENRLAGEQTIQIARLKRLEDIWPWALMYDLPVNASSVNEVCTGSDGGPLSYASCRDACKHPEKTRPIGGTVVCPFGFWGFRHMIEQPTQPGGAKAFADMPRDIEIAGDAVFEMPVANDLMGHAPTHRQVMEQELKFRVLDTDQKIYGAFTETPGADLVYFFCHGDKDEYKVAYLQVGDGQKILATNLQKWPINWSVTHPLVFINGCSTVALTPEDLASIMGPFVNAQASGIIGTEITVYTYLAVEFAERFFRQMLAGRQVGEIIKEIRLALLAKYNPLGLVYTPYCSTRLQIRRQ